MIIISNICTFPSANCENRNVSPSIQKQFLLRGAETGCLYRYKSALFSIPSGISYIAKMLSVVGVRMTFFPHDRVVRSKPLSQLSKSCVYLFD